MSAILRIDWYKLLLASYLLTTFSCQDRKIVDYQNSLQVFNSHREIRQSSRANSQFFQQFLPIYQILAVQQKALPIPQENDWLTFHHEAGQHFFQFSDSITPLDSAQQILYLIKLGDFTPEQGRLFQQLQQYLGVFYQTTTQELPSDTLAKLPPAWRRYQKGKWQLNSTQLVTDYLAKKLPTDALALLAVTTTDLYPNRKLAYVFGQASAKNRTAIISLARLGNLAFPKGKRLANLRALKLASHELGHSLSLNHCLAFSCNLNGSNHLQELDQQPTTFCPDCLAKLYWRVPSITINRFEVLSAFWEKKNSYLNRYYLQNFRTFNQIPNRLPF